MRQLIIILMIMISSILKGHAEIRNGYRDEVKQTFYNVQQLKKIAKQPGIPRNKKKELDKKIKLIESYYHQLRTDSERTEELIKKVKDIYPELYYIMSTIHDSEGNPTHIYVKAIKDMGNSNGTYGSTNLSSYPGSPNEYCSPYGRNTVSIRINSGVKALHLLVHEMGHAAYIVPNLKSYMEFYKKTYKESDLGKGHLPYDPSHATVKDVLREFQTRHKEYKRKKKR